MRYAGIILALISLPVFLAWLKSGQRNRDWAFFALGALPIFSQAMHLEVSFINWAYWPGHTKGIIVSLTDTLALAICMRFGRLHRRPVLFGVWIFYLVCSVPGVFVGKLITPSLFYLFSIMKAALYFRACYIVVRMGGLIPLVNGLAVAVIANALVAMQNNLGGEAQAAGLLGHRNFSGLISNLAVPVLLTLGLRDRVRPLMLAAVVGAIIAAIAGGSRAVILFVGVSIFLTMLLNIMISPTSKKYGVLAALVVGSFVAIPIAGHKLQARFAQEGTKFTLEKDSERLQFEAAANMMIKDHPLGVGLNQYVVTTNVDGYSDRAGIAGIQGSRSATVHNSYLLIRAEGGLIAWVGLCALLWIPLIYSYRLCIRKRHNPDRILAVPGLVALAVLSLHAKFEWAIPAVTSLYGLAFTYALTAAVAESARLEVRRVATSRRQALEAQSTEQSATAKVMS